MAKATQLLSVLARINPAIWDFIIPHGPLHGHAHAFSSRIDEVALTTNLDLDLAVLAPHGTVVTYAVDAAGEPTLNVRSLMMPNFTLRFALVYNFTDEMIAAAVAAISEALVAGELTPLPTVRYSLDEIAAAHDAVQGNAVGKVLVDIP
jgi:NADPH2:quinone reductase